jgi:pyruvate formate lyase activating enzyme
VIIGGLQKVSLSDFPGKIAAIVFTRGCNFRCPYCHNPELVDPEKYAPPLEEKAVLAFLRSRIGMIQGVVVSGGEPTLHDDLPPFLANLKTMGFHVKLDTNGSRPGMLETVLSQGCVDYVALDIKGPLSAYGRITRTSVDLAVIRQSTRLVIDSGLPHEMRTTYLASLLSESEMTEVAEMIRGCHAFFLQAFHATKLLDPALGREPAPDRAALERLLKAFRDRGIPAQVR